MDNNIEAQLAFDRWNQFAIHRVKDIINGSQDLLNTLNNIDTSNNNISTAQKYINAEISFFNLYLQKMSNILSTSMHMTLK